MGDSKEDKMKMRCKYFEDTVRQPPPIKTSLHLRSLREELLEKRISKKVQLKEYQNLEINHSEKIAIELGDLKRNRFVEDKRRLKLRETNEELRELESKLRAAYVAKARAIQIAEKESVRRYEQDFQREENEMLDKARIADKEREQKLMQEEHMKKMNLRQHLLDQMNEKKQRKDLQFQEFLKEKEIIDEIVRKINDEQLEEMREKLSRKIKFKEDMDEFVQAQKLWKEQQKREMEEENKRLLELMKKEDEDVEKRKKIREMELKRRQDISDKIAAEIYEKEVNERRKQEKLQELYLAERKALDEKKLHENLKKKQLEKTITLLQLEVQRDEMKDRKLQQQAEDRLYKEELMRSKEQYNEAEKEKERAKHEKMIQERQAIQENFEERKRLRAEHFAVILKTREQHLQEEKRRQEIIEEERIRMLKEHATNLLGYFPPGILKESDREHLALPPKNE